MKIEVKVDSERVIQAFQQAPKVVAANLRAGLDRAAMTMVTAARDELRANDSVSMSTLLQSIAFTSVGTYEREVSPNTDYAVYLEKGTAAGYYPPTYAIASWLRTRGAAEASVFRVKRHIFKHGTKAHPFWEPAFAKAEPTMVDIVAKYVERGVERAFGGGA